MNVYKVDGMTCSACETAITKAIRKELGDDVAVEADAGDGEVRGSGRPIPRRSRLRSKGHATR